MRKKVTIQIFIFSLLFTQISLRADSVENEEYDLELKIHCPIKNLRVGDEIPIIFTITNNGTREYKYEKRN